MRHNRYADQARVGVCFCLFSFTFVSFYLEFLARSCKIVHILGALDKNLAKILTKGFTKMQDVFKNFKKYFKNIKNIEKTSKNSLRKPERKRESHSVENSGKGGPFAFEWSCIYVRGFRCVQNEVLNTYSKSA